jgi:error-prone DNA polymerase
MRAPHDVAAAQPPGYAELHCVSNFSFLRGASHPAELVQRAAELGYRALAITDECSMAGAVRAWKAARQLPAEQGFRLIVGAEFRSVDALHLVLLAPTQAAYAQICALITLARRRSPKGQYRLTQQDFATGLDECLALWLPASPTPESGGAATAEELLAQGHWLRAQFGERLWLAVELHRGARDSVRLQFCLLLAQHCNIPPVASGDVHMHRRSRRLLQDVLTATRHRCSVQDAGRRLFPNGERHLRALPVLQQLYPPELLAETLRIAERCKFSLGSLRYEYPPELVPAGTDASSHLRALTEAGAARRWPGGVPPVMRAQIDKELALIGELRYEHFFLTVHNIVAYARKEGILCQGRGSAANSVVCYALEITAVNPERSELLFERFINRERQEPPDIDVDFEHERREEVIQYLYRTYGRERAALTAVVSRYRGRSARRDVARALGLDPALPPPAAESARFDALVKMLKKFPRHLSQHVGGFVISGTPLHELVPIENAAMPDRTVIQWDKNDLDTLGLLKVDVLALGMLTAIRRALAFTAQHRGWPTRMEEIPDDDIPTYDMICNADTVGVFQIESRAQMSMLPRLRPRNYYDLVVQVAIVRPGPIQGGMVDPYLQRRQQHRDDPAGITYPDPQLKPVLSRTLGVPIFQEQVMQITMIAAGFTPGEADQLRRAMTSSEDEAGLRPYRDRLLSGMRRNGYPEAFAEQIYQQILGFGEYGFPESHAASFALLTYISSWLKCHQPAAFFAALLNSQPMGFYQPAQLLQAARRAGVTVLPPDVLHSDWDYTLEPRVADSDDPADAAPLALRIGLRQVRSLRETDGRRIESQRCVPGGFADIAAFTATAQLDRTAIRALAAAGALRSLSAHRHDALWRALAVEPLPPLLAGAAPHEAAVATPAPTEAQDILADYRQLGLSTGRHPLALLRPWLRGHRIHSGEELRTLPDGCAVRVCGLITHLQRPGTAAGVTFMSLEDETGIVNIILWAQVFEAEQQTATQASLLVVSGGLQHRDGVIHVIARRLHDRSHWLARLRRRSRDFR